MDGQTPHPVFEHEYDLGICPGCWGDGCKACGQSGVFAYQITIPAPAIKPVTKRKTGKTYQRNPMLNANDRDHWRVISPIRKEWRRRGRGYANAFRLRELDWERARIDAFIQRPINNRSDAGNFYPTVKPIIDGLIDAKLLPDDNDLHLEGPYLHPAPKGPYAVILVITRLEPTK